MLSLKWNLYNMPRMFMSRFFLPHDSKNREKLEEKKSFIYPGWHFFSTCFDVTMVTDGVLRLIIDTETKATVSPDVAWIETVTHWFAGALTKVSKAVEKSSHWNKN